MLDEQQALAYIRQTYDLSFRRLRTDYYRPLGDGCRRDGKRFYEQAAIDRWMTKHIKNGTWGSVMAELNVR